MNLIRSLLVFALLAGSPTLALAWGNDGHKIVCEIAFQNLSPAAKQMIHALLPGSGSGSFSESCTWADQIREERPATAGWHFVNVPPDEPFVVENRDCSPPRRCAIWAIRSFQRSLADVSLKLSERREALFFLSHFVGDIHQPLHVSHAADRGGNAIPVDFLGQETNLHSVWDTKLLIAAGFRGQSGMARLLKITSIQKRNWGTYDVAAWANDALFKSRTFAYRDEHGRKIQDHDQLGRSYFRRRAPLVGLQLQQAGIRLASLLNEAAAGRSNFP